MNNIDLKEIILDWIYENYGPQEAEDPCYDIDDLVNCIIKKVKSQWK